MESVIPTIFFCFLFLSGDIRSGLLNFANCLDHGSNPLLIDDQNRTTVANQIRVFFDQDVAFGSLIPSTIFIQGIILYLMGQPLISRTGKIKLWEGDISGPENSQQISDWYTFTHILHGFIFYGIYVGLIGMWPEAYIGVKAAFILALLVEILWEVIENSPCVIERYRQQALAQGYTGDSVLNSLSDTVAMSTGFWVAFFVPPWATVGLIVMEELLLLVAIRDNLILNIIQLLHPIEIISKWQSQGRAGTQNSTRGNDQAQQQPLTNLDEK